MREPHIGRWANSVYGMQHSAALFHADGNRDHLATPDGLRERDGILELCEIKTTVINAGAASRGTICGRSGGSSTCSVPSARSSSGSVTRTSSPSHADPECRWVDRDENEIHRLVVLAEDLLRRAQARAR